jgi:hypothetical protein
MKSNKTIYTYLTDCLGKNKVNNMYIVKVHGGTTTEDIIEHVNLYNQFIFKKLK